MAALNSSQDGTEYSSLLTAKILNLGFSKISGTDWKILADWNSKVRLARK
jgi:hypothetical protein